MKKGEAVRAQKKFMLAFLDSECCVPTNEATISDYKESIEEMQEMLQYCIDTGDKSEIKFWRSQIQTAKEEMRIAIRNQKNIPQNNNLRSVANL